MWEGFNGLKYLKNNVKNMDFTYGLSPIIGVHYRDTVVFLASSCL